MKQTLVLMLTAAAVAAAQAPPEAGPGIGQKMKQNAAALKQYSYKRRTEVTINGQPRGARVDLVRYVDGTMETVPLETPAPPSPQAGRGLRGRIIERKMDEKKAEMKEDVEKMKALFESYMPSGGDSMKGVLEKAVISRTGPGPDADIKVVATGLKVPSDSFTLVWSVANQRPARVQIQAPLEGSPVQATMDFDSLPAGPFYVARTVLVNPARNLTVTIDTYDYTPAGTAKQ